MCQRRENGTVFIKGCLDDADPRETFGEICDNWEGPHGWITLFCERKEYVEDFQPITKDTIVLFCKLYDPDADILTYLGHVLVDQTILCSNILTSIKRMTEPGEMPYNVFAEVFEEENHFSIREISETQSSLAEVHREVYQLLSLSLFAEWTLFWINSNPETATKARGSLHRFCRARALGTSTRSNRSSGQ